MYKVKKAFSFVEIIITISIIALLAVIGISSKGNYDNNMNNAKVISDVETINNALTSFSEETQTLPMPGGNTNFYGIDTSYLHSYDDPLTFGVYGSITEGSFAKKYLDILPLDPKTNSYYSYGKTKQTNEFEIASIQYINRESITKVIGNYNNDTGPLNLIRQYNGSNFVYDGSNNLFPYNPEELVLVVTTATGAVYREGDTITTGADSLEIFFSDGSVSVIEANSRITLNELNFKGKDNLSTIVKIGLEAGKIWTKATKLNDSSEFEVFTQDSAAAVRGTIFGVSKDSSGTEVVVVEGIVDVLDLNKTLIKKVNSGESIKIEEGIDKGTATTIDSDSTPEFSKSIDGRDINEIVVNDPVEEEDPENTDPIETCTTFEIEGGEECVENSLGEEWELVAYAPYNHAGDIDMYYENTKLGKSHAAIINASTPRVLPGYCTGESDNQNSYCEVKLTDIRGVFIDRDSNNDDKIEYDTSPLNLGNNFAIEINVKKDALLQNGGRFIFDNSDNKGLMISKNSDESEDEYYIRYNGKFICSDVPRYDAPEICDLDFANNFETIIVENGNKITIGGKTFDITDNVNINNLFVGSKNNTTLQINGIINYVKIYKK